jgi:hypothetical protein
VASAIPTWDFLYYELVHCEDVEILFSWTEGGRFVTPSSFHWNDVDNNLVIDLSENATIDFVNPWTGALGVSQIWQTSLGGQIETDYASGAWISMAVTESPVSAKCLYLGGVWAGFALPNPAPAPVIRTVLVFRLRAGSSLSQRAFHLVTAIIPLPGTLWVMG